MSELLRSRAGTELGSGRTGRWPNSTRSMSASTRPKRRSRRSRRRPRRPSRPTGVTDEAAIRRAADDSIRAMMLIRTYRVRGHLAANLDPLGLTQRELPADLTPAYHGFTDADLDRKIYLGGCARLRAGLDPPDPAGAAGQLLRHGRLRIYAHQRPGGAALPPGADGGQGRRDQLHARGQALDPREGDPRRAVGEIPRQEICRHQALRPRRRRKRHPGAGSGDQIWRPDTASRRSTSAWPTAVG